MQLHEHAGAGGVDARAPGTAARDEGLEIGSGTGYNAALIAEIVGEHGLVVTVDIEDDVVSQTARLLTNAGYPQIRLLAVDGFFGIPGDSPYDRIIATVGCPDVSPHWLEQLSPDGQMLIPLRHRDANPLHQLWKERDGARARVVGHSGFMQMEGELRVDDYWSSVGWRPPGAGEEVHIGVDLDRFDASRSLLGLAYYMSIRDRRARFFTPSHGCGRAAEGGWAEVSREGVRWLGDERLPRTFTACTRNGARSASGRFRTMRFGSSRASAAAMIPISRSSSTGSSSGRGWS